MLQLGPLSDLLSNLIRNVKICMKAFVPGQAKALNVILL